MSDDDYDSQNPPVPGTWSDFVKPRPSSTQEEVEGPKKEESSRQRGWSPRVHDGGKSGKRR